MKKTKKPKLIPIGCQIYVKVDVAKPGENENGLLTPDSFEVETGSTGVVIRTGPSVKRVKAGQRIVFGAYAGEFINEYESGRKISYRLLRECKEEQDDDCIAILEDEK